MKIPELTQEQQIAIYSAISPIHSLNYDGREKANNAYVEALKIADAQGLLTKEASLALKPDVEITVRPDNVITWIENHNNTCITGYNNFKHYFKITLSDFRVYLKGYCSKNSITYNAKSLDDAKQYCQNWLDEYLKGVK